MIENELMPQYSDIESFTPQPTLIDMLLAAAPVNAVAATKVYGTSTSVVTLTAKTKGVAGNQITLQIVEREETGDLEIAVTGTAIVATLAYAEGATTTTGAQLVTAINADEDAAALVTGSAGGAGVMAAAAAAALAGGVNGTLAPKKGIYFMDSSYLYVAVAANTVSGTNWRRVSLGSAY